VAKAAQSDTGELSPTPPVDLDGDDGSSNSGSGSSGSSSPPAAAPLPDTGADLPTTALLALGLLVSGIGLRMRTVDERIF
jgi:LPXTG-motif cell wall-anchored protein